ncbi:MAG: DUF309 domain-containing protein [Candidatus Marinimicrobia bacterium]|nr:DUF309 domain-containing protein [Candidatus Neomarinimicrobiota bacterium]
MGEQEQIESLFEKGLSAYQNGHYFDAHEAWEEMWSDFYLVDRDLIQGLIQLSVSFVHLSNNNLIGAKSLLKKCQKKFDKFNGLCRGIDITSLKNSLKNIEVEYQKLESNQSFHWDIVPSLEK